MTAERGLWAEVADNLCYHFDIAEKFDLSATFNAQGSRSMAFVIRRMAKLLDDEVMARVDHESLEECRKIDASSFEETC